MYFVYLLLCKGGTLYTGSTNNPDKRWEDHVSGKGARYTRSHPPIKRVYLEEVPTKSEALKRESEIKSWTRVKKIHELRLQF